MAKKTHQALEYERDFYAWTLHNALFPWGSPSIKIIFQNNQKNFNRPYLRIVNQTPYIVISPNRDLRRAEESYL